MHQLIEQLRVEHHTILSVVDRAEAVAVAAERGAAVPAAALDALREFFTLYVHGIHKLKEDSVLFPWLRLKGVREGAGCVGALAAEHGEIAASVPDFRQDVPWITPLRAYCSLLRSHIRHEDDIVFPLVERSISDEEASQLVPAFEKIDASARRADVDEVVRVATSLPYGI